MAEGQDLVLGCPSGKTIDDVIFASWGMPSLADEESGCAEGFKEGVCPRTGQIVSSNNSLPVVQKLCIGKTTCAVPAAQTQFADDPEGPPQHDPCKGPKKALAAEIHCTGDPPGLASCSGSCYNQPFVMPPWPNPQAGDAAMYPQISGGAVQQYENHVLRHGNTEPFGTLFCWHGFQYVRVTSHGDTTFTGALDAITALEIYTNLTATGILTFGGEGEPAAEGAAEVLTHINQMTQQSQRSNVAAYMPTDCELSATELDLVRCEVLASAHVSTLALNNIQLC